MTYTSNDFKPGDLAWATVRRDPLDKRPSVMRDVLIQRRDNDLYQWWLLDTRGSLVPRELVADLRPAHVLSPGERVAPEGSVVLDPEDSQRLYKILMRDVHGMNAGRLHPSELAKALTALAAEQTAPDPATVWTDGDVVQGTEDAGVWLRTCGAWDGVGRTLSKNDVSMTGYVRKGWRVLRQQSTQIGCDQ